MNWLLYVTTLALLEDFGLSVEEEGIRHLPEDKIVGGSLVSDIKLQPYMVSINVNSLNDWWFLCGGSLISPNFVVTACHCLAQFDNYTGMAIPLHLPMDKWLFVAGTVRLDRFDETSQVRNPESLLYHPECTVEEMAKYDIAVAKMNRPFEITENVKPAGILSYEPENFEQQFTKLRGLPPKCVVSGWGTTTKILDTSEKMNRIPMVTPTPSTESNQLKTVTMFIMDTGRCWSYFRGLDSDDAFEEDDGDLKAYKQICITSRQGNEGFCTGDSGSPLVCNTQLVAVVSSSVDCGKEGPQICQKVTVLLEWLGPELCADNIKCRMMGKTVLRTESLAGCHMTPHHQ